MLQSWLEMGKLARPDDTTKIRILIVEKHAAVRRALRKRLNAAPHLEVVAAVQEPIAALPLLNPIDVVPGEAHDEARVPDVVLLGLQNGSDEELFHTLDIVQQMARCSTAIIILAPYADEVERLLLHQAGAAGYLLKYIDSPRLIEEIEAVAQRGRDPVAKA
jgi:DNA-binding NarL/FixJ family response regulator